MLNELSWGIVSTGNSTIERLYMYRWLYREGIIYYADISMAYGKPNDHRGVVIKYPFQSAGHFHLILQQIKLQYKNNATHPVVLFKYKTKRPSTEGLEAL